MKSTIKQYTNRQERRRPIFKIICSCKESFTSMYICHPSYYSIFTSCTVIDKQTHFFSFFGYNQTHFLKTVKFSTTSEVENNCTPKVQWNTKVSTGKDIGVMGNGCREQVGKVSLSSNLYLYWNL